MPQRSTIELLPEEMRARIDEALVHSNFSNYRALAESINKLLAESGLELQINRTSLHRYGQEFEERISALKRSTEIARTLAKEIGDDEGAMNDALMRLVQDRLFNLTLEMEIDPKEVDIYKLGRVVAELGKASVMQKRHQVAQRAKAEAVATTVAETAKQNGLSAETIETIKRDILGIVND
jgi:response regulator RpfG family c-di-GMP phosphodiesterase